MVGSLFKKIKGSPQGRAWKKYRPQIESINGLEPDFDRLTDAELTAKTDEFRRRLSRGASEDDILPEAFAAVREAAKRALGQRHFDVQLMGGLVLHYGKIAEMKTGEGKTLVATLPAYLNALAGHGVHVVTVNDYLARRDPTWMGPVFHALGLSVGCLQNDTSFTYVPGTPGRDPTYKDLAPATRREAYAADITYGTNNEYGFDYLRDNMAVELAMQVQRGRNYAIVDEVDNILIDEARTPLIISGPAQEPVSYYYTMAKLAPRLIPEEDYVTIDERSRAISLTEEGMSKIEQWIKVDNLYDPENFHLVQYVENALRAHVLFKRDKEYVVKDGEVIIVDEFTGRMQPGRRWSDGMHQAIEAKEGMRIQQKTVTYATITLQNYFRMYKKLSGMTGTALTEEEEFLKIYGLAVAPIPTNAPFVRRDHTDLIYQSESAKWKAVAEDIRQTSLDQRPVLVGTTSIENSQKLSEHLRKRGIPHNVLNAKQHEKEAFVVAQAGRPGAVTVATNMAGRGTDIVLGGNPGVMDIPGGEWQRDHDTVVGKGGLLVIGTEHHEARRIDDQLRGRSGRQGDPGETRFYACMEDEVVKRFGGERAKGIMEKVSGWTGLDKDSPLESGVITKILEGAQSRVEGFHFEARKNLQDFDSVLNVQRGSIYGWRNRILASNLDSDQSRSDLREEITKMTREEFDEPLGPAMEANLAEEWDINGIAETLRAAFPDLPPALDGPDNLRALAGDLSGDARGVRNRLTEGITRAVAAHTETSYDRLEAELGHNRVRALERLVMLRNLDIHWVQYLTTIEDFRQGIGLRAYGQRNPLVEYQTEGRRRYDELMERVRHDVVHSFYRLAISPETSAAPARRRTPVGAMAGAGPSGGPSRAVPARKIGRNAPCYCGSGKKFKRCHGGA